MRTLGDSMDLLMLLIFSGGLFGDSGSPCPGGISFPNWAKFPESRKNNFQESRELTMSERNSRKYFQEFRINLLVRIGLLSGIFCFIPWELRLMLIGKESFRPSLLLLRKIINH